MAEDRKDLGELFARVNRRLAEAERPLLENHGLAMWPYAVLTRLTDREAPTQYALADDIGYDKTRVIAVLDGLEGAGLVTRRPDPSDRRARIIAITAAGRRRQAAAQKDIRAMEEAVLSQLPANERNVLIRALARLARV